MPQHLLVAYDFSLHADYALACATRLATCKQARLALVHAAVLTSSVEASTVQQELENVAARCAVQPDIYLLKQSPAVALPDFAAHLPADLLLIGSHHSQRPEGFAGTLSEQLLHASNTPLLVVTQANAWKKVLVAMNYTEAAQHALRYTAQLVAEDAAIEAVHVHEIARQHINDAISDIQFEQDLFQNTVEEQRQTLPVTVRLSTHFLIGERTQSLRQFIAEQQIDLLVLGVKKRSVCTDVLAAGWAVEWLNTMPCDLLFVPSF